MEMMMMMMMKMKKKKKKKTPTVSCTGQVLAGGLAGWLDPTAGRESAAGEHDHAAGLLLLLRLKANSVMMIRGGRG